MTDEHGRVPDPDGSSAAEEEPTAHDDRLEDRPGREPGEMVVALSPRQIMGGFAVLAGLIIMLRRRRRDRD
ncbi:MAG: hypothetical protein V4515_11660 [Chloroflexota bacterium]